MVLVLVVAAAVLLVLVALGYRARDRPGPSIEGYHHALDVLEELSGRTRGPGPAAPPAARRRPLVLVAVILAVGAGGAVLGLLLARSPGGRTTPAGLHRAPTVGAARHEQAAAGQAPAAGLPGGSSLVGGAPATSLASTSSLPPTTTTSARRGGDGPLLSALQPAEAAPGQTVTLLGSGFQSPDGTVVATFGSQAAPTRCPSAQRCLATVPPAAGPSAVVRVETESGRSAGLTFRWR